MDLKRAQELLEDIETICEALSGILNTPLPLSPIQEIVLDRLMCLAQKDVNTACTHMNFIASTILKNQYVVAITQIKEHMEFVLANNLHP